MSENTKLAKQNDVIIALLARMAFKDGEIREIVTRKKQNPENYVRGYNACDGEHSVTQIASVVGVKQPTISPILSEWEEAGIIYDAGKQGGKFYNRIRSI